MGSQQHYTVEEVIAAIREAQTPTGAGKVLGCHAETIRNYARRYATVKAALLSERKGIVDHAERGLFNAVKAAEPWAVTFALKTLAKDVYSERTEHTGADGGPIVIADARERLASRIASLAARLEAAEPDSET